MSQKYPFERLELRPFDGPGLDIGELEPRETEPPLDGGPSFDDVKGSRSTFETVTAYDPLSYATTQDNPDRGLFAQYDSIRSSYLQRKSRRFATLWITAALAVFVAIFSAWYTYRVMVDQDALPAALQLQPGTTVLVVNILSHLVAYLSWSLFSDTTEALRWALACRPKGILLSTFLVLSRATPFAGVAYLCTTKGPHQIWGLQRILSFVFSIVLGLVLITNVTYKNVYTPFSRDFDVTNTTNATQRVVAGLAPVSSYGLQNATFSMVNIIAASYTIAFITDPRFVASVEPVMCNGKDCLSIFLPGGMDAVRVDDSTGLKTLFSGEFPGDYTTIVVNDAPGFQIEYASISSVDRDFQFDRNSDCTMYLQSIGDGLYICMVEKGNQMFLGMTVCPYLNKFFNTCQTDLNWTTTITWNTTVAMFSRKATVAYDAVNISILSIESITDPIPTPIDIKDFQLYCDIVFASVPPTLNITRNESTYENACTDFSVGFGFGFILRLYEMDYTLYYDGGLSLLRGFLAVPFQFSTALQQMGDINKMPKENHVTASLSKNSYRAIVEPWTVWVFAGLAALVTSWGLGCLVWLTIYGPHSPNTSFFPEIDITSKSGVHANRKFYSDGKQKFEVAGETLEDLGKLTRMHGLGNGMSQSVVEAIRGKRVFCGSFPGSRNGEKVIVLVTEQGQVKLLNQHESYS